MTAVLLAPIEPGSAEWFTYMTASKIAAVVGLSSYESPFSLWHRMAGLIPPDPDNDQKRRGHYLEPAIRAWFADQHPDMLVSTTGSWVHVDRPWQAATPDALVHERGADTSPPIALAEFKSAHEDDQWGQPGTDDIPVGYRCQVMWQMDTLGVHTCYVAALTRHLEFAEYVVDYDAEEAELLRGRGSDFMTSLARDERPSIDSHDETYRAIRLLHPDIEDRDVELDEDLARQYIESRAALDVAEMDAQLAKSRVADALGRGHRARFNRKTIAQRQAKGGGTPYLVAGRNLPNLSTSKVA